MKSVSHSDGRIIVGQQIGQAATSGLAGRNMANKVPVAITCFFALSFLVGCGSGSSPAPLRTLTIVSPAPPDGTIGASYGGTQGFSFSANGGSPPYVWSWS